MPDATTTCAGISPRRRSVRRWRAADARRWRSVPSASHVRSATRAHSAVGTLPTAKAYSRSPGQPLTEVPLLAASAIRTRIVACLYTLLGLVAVPRPRVTGAIARFTDPSALLSPAISLVICVAFCRAIGWLARVPL